MNKNLLNILFILSFSSVFLTGCGDFLEKRFSETLRTRIFMIHNIN